MKVCMTLSFFRQVCLPVMIQVSSAASTSIQRTARECEIKWLSTRKSHVNNSPWTPGEISRVKALVEGYKEGEVDWTEIALKLGVRTPPTFIPTSGTPDRLVRPIDFQWIVCDTLCLGRLTYGLLNTIVGFSREYGFMEPSIGSEVI